MLQGTKTFRPEQKTHSLQLYHVIGMLTLLKRANQMSVP